MNKTTVASFVVPVVAICIGAVMYKGSAEATFEHLNAKYPELRLDRKTALKVHRKMVSEALRQSGPTASAHTDEDYDRVFVQKYVAASNL